MVAFITIVRIKKRFSFVFSKKRELPFQSTDCFCCCFPFFEDPKWTINSGEVQIMKIKCYLAECPIARQKKE